MENGSLIVQMVAAAAAVLGGGVALASYRSQIERDAARFVSEETDRFFADIDVSNALRMLDYSVVTIDFTHLNQGGVHLISRETLTRALDDQIGTFSAPEHCVRETLDRFFTRLERFSSFVEAGLVAPRHLRPYLLNTAKMLAGRDAMTNDTGDAIAGYVSRYGFDGVTDLCAELGYPLARRKEVA